MTATDECNRPFRRRLADDCPREAHRLQRRGRDRGSPGRAPSGTQRPAALRTGADEPRRLAGKLSFDDTPSGGPKVDVEFDAPIVKELKAAR